MKLQLLVATVDGGFFARGYAPPFDDCLVINQINRPGEISRPGESACADAARTFDYGETGLSRSRNRALQRAAADIVVIADDDVRHPAGAQETVARAFAAHPRADIITFQARTPDGAPFKRYPSRARRHTTRSIMRVSSWEIALRLESVRAAGLRFDERFGLGAEFPTGEENIFLLDALRRGLTLRYVPQPIAIHPRFSSGADFSTAAAVAAKGAVFGRMFGAASAPVEFAFACKKYRLSPFSCLQFYRYMREGSARFKRSDRGKTIAHGDHDHGETIDPNNPIRA